MSRTFVITGAASGIGEATARRLTEGGHRVIGGDIRHAEIIADLSTAQGRAEMIARVRDLASDGLDGILTSAGVANPDRPDLVLSTNFFGTTAIFEGLHSLLRTPGARCVAVASAAMIQAGAETADLEQLCLENKEVEAIELANRLDSALVYPCTKHALNMWARRTAVTPQWGGSGISLNVVAPGVIRTPMTQASANIPGMAEMIRKVAPRVTESVGEPEDVAELIDFLLNCESNYLVGQTIFIDGGTEAILRSNI